MQNRTELQNNRLSLTIPCATYLPKKPAISGITTEVRRRARCHPCRWWRQWQRPRSSSAYCWLQRCPGRPSRIYTGLAIYLATSDVSGGCRTYHWHSIGASAKISLENGCWVNCAFVFCENPWVCGRRPCQCSKHGILVEGCRSQLAHGAASHRGQGCQTRNVANNGGHRRVGSTDPRRTPPHGCKVSLPSQRHPCAWFDEHRIQFRPLSPWLGPAGRNCSPNLRPRRDRIQKELSMVKSACDWCGIHREHHCTAFADVFQHILGGVPSGKMARCQLHYDEWLANYFHGHAPIYLRHDGAVDASSTSAFLEGRKFSRLCFRKVQQAVLPLAHCWPRSALTCR